MGRLPLSEKRHASEALTVGKGNMISKDGYLIDKGKLDNKEVDRG